MQKNITVRRLIKIFHTYRVDFFCVLVQNFGRKYSPAKDFKRGRF